MNVPLISELAESRKTESSPLERLYSPPVTFPVILRESLPEPPVMVEFTFPSISKTLSPVDVLIKELFTLPSISIVSDPLPP